MSTFIPRGYCDLTTAIERAAELLFSEEFKRTTITPEERQRYDQYERAVEALRRQAAWQRATDIERKRAEEVQLAYRKRLEQMTPDERRLEEERQRKAREKAEAAHRASACNIGSSIRREQAEPGLRPLSETQEQAARHDATRDEVVVAVEEKKGQDKSLREQARKHLRHILWEGELVGHLHADGELFPMPRRVWDADWDRLLRGEQIRLSISGKNRVGRALISVAGLEALLAGRSTEPQSAPSRTDSRQQIAAHRASGQKPNGSREGEKSRELGKLPRVLIYLKRRFPNGVPSPGIEPRKQLISKILDADKSLCGLSRDTLARAIRKYNQTLSQ